MAAASTETIRTTCVVAGGGPAGMMCGVLLARAGVDVVVLEKHKDFLRDFRGDTIHPSTLDVIAELGWLDEFLKLPHQQARHLTGVIGGERMRIADFTHLPTRCQFIALMPQWDFLDFLARKGAEYPSFHLRMETEVTDLIERRRPHRRRAGSIRPTGDIAIDADLVIGADGRQSVVRQTGRAQGRRYRRADRRAVDAADAAALRRLGAARAGGRRQDVRHDRPRRLLAVRVRDPEGRS